MKLSHAREGARGHVVAMSVARRLHWKSAENGGLSACLWRGVSSAAACMGGEYAYVVSKRGAFKMHIGAIDAPTANCWRSRCRGKCAHMLVDAFLGPSHLRVWVWVAGCGWMLRILKTAGVEVRSTSRTSISTRNPRPTPGHPHSTMKSLYGSS